MDRGQQTNGQMSREAAMQRKMVRLIVIMLESRFDPFCRLTMCKSSDPGLEGESSLNAGYRVIVWDGPMEGTVPQTFLAP